MCPFFKGNVEANFICIGISIFLLVWVIFVPIAITSRLEKIIKLLEKKS
jgi:hypothetical protein